MTRTDSEAPSCLTVRAGLSEELTPELRADLSRHAEPENVPGTGGARAKVLRWERHVALQHLQKTLTQAAGQGCAREGRGWGGRGRAPRQR